MRVGESVAVESTRSNGVRTLLAAVDARVPLAALVVAQASAFAALTASGKIPDVVLTLIRALLTI